MRAWSVLAILLIPTTLALPAPIPVVDPHYEVTLFGPTLVGDGLARSWTGKVEFATRTPSFRWTPLEPQSVALLVDGAIVAQTTTDEDGAFGLLRALAGRGMHTVQAARLDDAGVPAERSRVLDVAVAVRPTAPELLAASPDPLLGNLNLSWATPSDDGGAALSGYTVYRRANASVPWGFRASMGNATRAFADSGPSGATYQYRVTARNLAGEGADAELTATFPVPGPIDAVRIDRTRYWICTTPGSCREYDGNWYVTVAPGSTVDVAAVFYGTVLYQDGPVPAVDVGGPVSVTAPTGTVQAEVVARSSPDGIFRLQGPSKRFSYPGGCADIWSSVAVGYDALSASRTGHLSVWPANPGYPEWRTCDGDY